MNKLNLLDQLFYKLETVGGSPVLMGGAMIVDPTGSPYPLNGKKLADHLAARMEKIPVLRQKLIQDSLRIGHVRMVDDPDFNVRNHITITRLKAPGNYQQLMDALGVFSSQRLDFSRPLWHYEVIEGLEGGRFAIALHLHHCIMDGIGATEALSGMWDNKPVPPEKPRTRAWQVEKTPTSLALLRDALLENVERVYIKTPAFLFKNSYPLTKALVNTLASSFKDSDNSEKTVRTKIPRVRKTSLNVSRLSSSRVVSYLEFPLSEVKALASHYQCSINDLALLLNSYALQHYFAGIGEKIDFDLIAGMPINIRKEGDGSTGNAVTVARVNLHNTIQGIESRLKAIKHDTAAIKRPFKSAPGNGAKVDGKALMGLFSPILLDAMVYGIFKFNLLDKAILLNLAITNVPGSRVPQYIAGARMVSMVPMAPALDSCGLTITISSNDMNLAIGYHGCGETVRNKELFVDGARICFDALKKSARLNTVVPAAKTVKTAKTAQTVKKSKSVTTAAKKTATKTVATKKPSVRAKRPIPASVKAKARR